MKEFKFLKDVQERTYSTHLRAFLDEDEFSLRERMLRQPGGPEREWMIKRLLMEYCLVPGRSDSETFSWGTMCISNMEMFYNFTNEPCIRGRVIVTEVNEPSYVENVTIYSNEFQSFKRLIYPNDEQ